MSGADSGPRTVFHNKQLCRRFVLWSTTTKLGYPNPTWWRTTLQSLGVMGDVESKTRSSMDLTTGATHLSHQCSCLLNNNNNSDGGAPWCAADWLHGQRTAINTNVTTWPTIQLVVYVNKCKKSFCCLNFLLSDGVCENDWITFDFTMINDQFFN